MKREVIDVTLLAKKINMGHRHPNNIALKRLSGFSSAWAMRLWDGPEVSMTFTILRN